MIKDFANGSGCGILVVELIAFQWVVQYLNHWAFTSPNTTQHQDCQSASEYPFYPTVNDKQYV